MLDELASLRDIRHIDKTFYLGSHDLFYQFVYDAYSPSNELLSIVEQSLTVTPASWRTKREGVWTHVLPLTENAKQAPLLEQGWKIHVSATNVNCAEVLEAVASLLIHRRSQFKFANDVQTLCLMTSKRWPRGGSGKFITIYPRSTDDFKECIEELYLRLTDFRGSYILSDRRYKDSSCIYYRYGGIRSNESVDMYGRRLEFLRAPDGTLQIDKRNPFYDPPVWVDEPFPSNQLESDVDDMTLCNGRFAIESALSFSNTGGVYLSRDKLSGERVVVKEARPGVELGIAGVDATTRLANEANMLRAMGESGITPKLVTTFQDWENHYLVEEYLEARNIRRIMLEHTPLLKVHPVRSDQEQFYSKFKTIFVDLLNAIAEFHRRGIIIGDLSPLNILITETLSVRIIDLEGAFLSSANVRQDLHTPGFRARAKGRKHESDFSDDIYAVGVVMMYSMFPIAALAFLRTDVFENVLPVIIDDIGWAATPVLIIIRGLVEGTMSCAEAASLLERNEPNGQSGPTPHSLAAGIGISEIPQKVAKFITANWRSDAKRTLFPIDPHGERTNPASLFLGSSGIIWSLRQVGANLPEGAMNRFRSDLAVTEPHSLSIGLLNGAAGIAWALLEIGDHDQGLRFLRSANSANPEGSHHSLYYGLAGLGLVNIAAYRRTGDVQHLDRATLLAQTLANNAQSNERGVFWKDAGGIRLGMGYGQSGVALFLLRLSQASGEPSWRVLGRRALQFDLSFGIEVEPGVTSFGGEPDHRGTVLPYIEQGSGGIAKVAMRYGVWEGLEPIIADVHRKYSAFPGLIYGLTGLLDVLTDAQRYSGDEKYALMAERPLQGLRSLYLFDTPQGLAAPGDNLFRVSCDYGTGLSGIMYTLHRHTHLHPDDLTLDWLDEDREALSGY